MRNFYVTGFAVFSNLFLLLNVELSFGEKTFKHIQIMSQILLDFVAEAAASKSVKIVTLQSGSAE